MNRKAFVSFMEIIEDYENHVIKAINEDLLPVEGFYSNFTERMIQSLTLAFEHIDQEYMENILFNYVFNFQCGKRYHYLDGNDYYLFKIREEEFAPKSPEELYNALCQLEYWLINKEKDIEVTEM